jgi:hypothetical protein
LLLLLSTLVVLICTTILSVVELLLLLLVLLGEISILVLSDGAIVSVRIFPQAYPVCILCPSARELALLTGSPLLLHLLLLLLRVLLLLAPTVAGLIVAVLSATLAELIPLLALQSLLS